MHDKALTPINRYGTIVVGLGAAGSAALYHLAKRGVATLGIDRYSPPHEHGSSHGDTRITRLAIGEGAHYTPLAMRSHALWRTLERESVERLLTQNGLLIVSSAGTSAQLHVENFFSNTVAAAERYGIAHELLDAAEIRRRFPPFAAGADERGYFEPSAGFLRPEACVRAHLDVARRNGADVHCGERVVAFEPRADRVVVATGSGRYEADNLVVAAGAWLPTLVDTPMARLFRVYRQVMFWFDVDGPIEPFLPERFPAFVWELPRGERGVYGFPAIDGPRGGVKVASEWFGDTTSADTVERAVDPAEIERVHAACIAPYLPAVSRRCVRATTCLYTVTPDFGFVIDAHPRSPRVLIASPCSGHGFKHAPAIGEALAQWIVEARKPEQLEPFAFGRF